MLTNYIGTAMHKATYELLEDGTFYGEIPECQANISRDEWEAL